MIGVWESVDMCAPTSIMAETIPLHSGIENAGPRGAPTLIPSFELLIIGTMTLLLPPPPPPPPLPTLPPQLRRHLTAVGILLFQVLTRVAISRMQLDVLFCYFRKEAKLAAKIAASWY